jgi:hypothetical protein
MSEEQDGFMLNAFGVDLGQLAQNIKQEGSAVLGQVASTVSQAVQGVQGAVEGAIDGVTGAVVGAVKKVAGAVAPSGSPSAGQGASGGGSGTFPLGGSVGRGGKNAPNDVSAVQAALGISADGQSGAQTIAAIEAFQRNMGQAKPDGRIDAGGATERALAGGGGGSAHAAPTNDGDPSDGTGASNADAGGVAGIDGAKLAADVVAKAPGNSGLIGELNHLEDFTTTDPDPVPDDASTFVGVSPAALANQIKDKEFGIAQLEKTRTNLCLKTRSDARLLEKNLISSLTLAFSGTGALSLSVIVTSAGGLIATGSSLGLLTTMVIAIVAEHELYRTYRDNLRLMVDKAKLDLTILNTNIAVEKKRLVSMKKAAGQPVGDEIAVKPFVRPAAPPVESDEETPESDK